MGDFEELINCNRDDSDEDDDNDVMPARNNQVERCIEVLRGVLKDAVPRRELVRVTVAADCDPNRVLNFYFPRLIRNASLIIIIIIITPYYLYSALSKIAEMRFTYIS